jgi:glycosyltransferase involved in cell wall biosynthesis
MLQHKINELGLHDNAVIIRKYQTTQTINNYLRTAKIAVFPYSQDPKNIVYGASGALRVAMANNIPVIASSSHMFDDLEGIIPRPSDVESLADDIDKIFSNANYRKTLLDNQSKYIKDNTWDISADRYLSLYYEITR